MSDDAPEPRAPRPCPICGKPASPAHRPFCSPRCGDIDLGRWLKGGYVVPGEPAPDDAITRDDAEETR